ncbi:MAG: PEP-CTERM sorting domain-containing protein [Planctomycetota bacterium]|nr:MAG: PEP-CTERM sorting domain-containing protein [Planctomycetota bacterium]
MTLTTYIESGLIIAYNGGWLVQIPEPMRVVMLALGGPAVLRRRR